MRQRVNSDPFSPYVKATYPVRISVRPFIAGEIPVWRVRLPGPAALLSEAAPADRPQWGAAPRLPTLQLQAVLWSLRIRSYCQIFLSDPDLDPRIHNPELRIRIEATGQLRIRILLDILWPFKNYVVILLPVPKIKHYKIGIF
jgi:hypothetical protein